MIARYTRPAMGRIWSDEHKYRCWLVVETAASQALARFGLVPQPAADAIRDKGGFTVDRINQIEAEVRHDVIAFTTTVAEHIADPEASRWLHYGLTSTDVVDTAQSLQLREASAILRTGILQFLETLKARAIEFKHTPIIGRTHGVHAEPLLLWYSEMQRNLARFDAAAEDLRVGKLSGAVGTFGHLKPEHEEAICAELGLRPVAVATQVVQRDRHAAYIAALAILCSTLDKIATEVRHLQRTEVREAEEFFSEKQKGSSAMPHKRNPITSEQISGLARVVRANAQVAFEDIALWHERDISHSSVERIILPDSAILVDYMLARMTDIVANMKVFPARMQRNLDSTQGLVFSGTLLQDLVEHGAPREDAYKWVQGHAMAAWESETSFQQRIADDPNVRRYLDAKALAHTFDLKRQLRAVDAIFHRVFGRTSAAANHQS
jgi:adenylosuccinate lyase